MVRKKISRSEARRLGLERFYTGVACFNGHLAERYTSTGQCIQCREATNLRHSEILRNKGTPRSKERAIPTLPDKPIVPLDIKRIHKFFRRKKDD